MKIKQKILQILISITATRWPSFSVSFGAGEGMEISRDGVTVRGRLIAPSMEDEEATKKSASSGGKRLLIRVQKWPTWQSHAPQKKTSQFNADCSASPPPPIHLLTPIKAPSAPSACQSPALLCLFSSLIRNNNSTTFLITPRSIRWLIAVVLR